MISDLFSALDGRGWVLIWCPSTIFTIIIVVSLSWKSNFILVINNFILNIWKGSSSFYSFWLVLFRLIFLLIINNLVGLTPYTYRITSSLWSNRSLALLIWGSLILSGVLNNPKAIIAHLTPSGSPLALASFLVLIELVRIIIRPITLTVRLVANISAGHIVLSLIANCLRSLLRRGIIPTFVTSLIILGYVLFEVLVRVIQAYIFVLLIRLYASEHPYLLKHFAFNC